MSELQELKYLASPYSHKDAWMRELRFKAISRIAGALMVERGIGTFCPITHCHSIAEHAAVDPVDYDFWMAWDGLFHPACAGLIVAMLPGFLHSRGVKAETLLFTAAGKPVERLQVRRWFTSCEWKMLKAGVE